MKNIYPEPARTFAVEVIQKLREAGFTALFAGGCVRDQLLGLPRAKDYDVATNAKPEQVRALFGHRRTLAIGQTFGVISVIGPKGAGQVEVATFRRDVGYSDGRHPDQVAFCEAEEDAKRRDFTINGLFYDPFDDQVIDYVGGREDLQRRLIRAIGDPFARFSEDRLRMLRAVRMAARFSFTVDPATLSAIQQQAHGLQVVSAERIGTELRLMLAHEHRARAAELLGETGLLPVILPELQGIAPSGGGTDFDATAWRTTLGILRSLQTDRYSPPLTALLRPCARRDPLPGFELDEIAWRLRLTNDERKEIGFLLEHEESIRSARSLPWPRLQRILIEDLAPELLVYCRAVAQTVDGHVDDIQYCEQKRGLLAEVLNPPPLITGDDLRQIGMPPGPAYRRVLDTVRDAQLEGRITSRQEALEMARGG